MHEILRPIVVSFILCGHLMFQHKARPYVERICTQFLEAENVRVLPWPAYSPDMSPVEPVCDTVHQRVRQCVPIPVNIQKLCRAIEEEWDNIPQATINSLINSMWRRCCAARGKWWSRQILTGFLIHAPTFYSCYLWPIDAYMYYQSCEIHRLGPNEFI